MSTANDDLGKWHECLQELIPEDVKGLLGSNLIHLRDFQNTPLIREWIQKQKQSALDRLGLGFRGGLPEGFIVLKRRKQQE